MSRKADEHRLKLIFEVVNQRPGRRAAEYARRLRIHTFLFNTLLAMMNDRGLLLSEDSKGRLWPWPN